jgi:hypothetical protein
VPVIVANVIVASLALWSMRSPGVGERAEP